MTKRSETFQQMYDLLDDLAITSLQIHKKDETLSALANLIVRDTKQNLMFLQSHFNSLEKRAKGFHKELENDSS